MTREEAIDIIKCLAWHTRPNEEDVEQAIEALEQEPFINKPCVSSGVCEYDKNVVLDKIRADIQFIKDKCLPNSIAEEYEQKGLQEALDILDKYKAEIEPQESIEKESIPYLMHKKMDIPISACQKAYDVAIDYLRSQAKLKG